VEQSGPLSNERPVLDAEIGDLALLVPPAWEALTAANEPPKLFRRGNTLARVLRDPDGVAFLERVSPAILRHHLARAAHWSENGLEVAPPGQIVTDMLADPAPPLSILDGIRRVPYLGSDGTIQVTAGYHEASRVLLDLIPDLIVPDLPAHPTAPEITAARDLIVGEWLGDFPFVDASDLAHGHCCIERSSGRLDLRKGT
jgi:hypothetical protein